MGVVDVTPQGVLDAIEKFCQENETDFIRPGCEFAHIVLDDINLQDADIRYCLDGRADRWERSAIARVEGLSEWSRTAIDARIEDIRSYKAAAIAFLKWLLSVPDSVRTDAEWLEHTGEIPEAEKGVEMWEL